MFQVTYFYSPTTHLLYLMGLHLHFSVEGSRKEGEYRTGLWLQTLFVFGEVSIAPSQTFADVTVSASASHHQSYYFFPQQMSTYMFPYMSQ